MSILHTSKLLKSWKINQNLDGIYIYLQRWWWWCSNYVSLPKGTLPETNIAPENRASQKERSIPTILFQGLTVSSREGNK